MKKKLAALFFAGIMAFSAVPAHGASEIEVFVDGVKIFFDQPPVIQNDRTLVPMRAIFEALGAEVEWIPAEKRVNAFWGKDSLDLWIGEREMKTGGGNTITLDVPAQIIGDRTMVPLRAVSEAMDAVVEWSAMDRCVYITSYVKGLTVDSEIYDYSFVLPDGFYVEGRSENQGIEQFVATDVTGNIYIVVTLSEGLYDVKSYYDANVEYIDKDPQLALEFGRLVGNTGEETGWRIDYKEAGKYMKTIFAKDSRNFECSVIVQVNLEHKDTLNEVTENFLKQFGI